jgi:outer membrane protein with beta-barrel domain
MMRNAQPMNWLRGVTFAAAAVSAASAFAGEGPRYTYVDVGYERINPDNFNDDADAGALAGSLAVANNVHVFAGYSYGRLDTRGISVDLESAEAGAGLNFPLTNTMDIVAEAAYLWAKVDADQFGSEDDDGYGVQVGLRAMLTPKFELNGGVSYTDVSDSETAGFLGAVYSFTDVFAMTAGVSVGQDVTSYGAGVRFYLGSR